MTKRISIQAALGRLFIVLALSTGAVQAEFKVYDSIISSGKPDLAPYGLHKITVVYEGFIAPGSEPSETTVRNVANQEEARGINGPMVLDVEKWETDIRRVSTTEADSSLSKLRQIAVWFKQEFPTVQGLGYYSIPPLRDYWSPVTGDTAGWMAANDYHAPLIAVVDALYPSLYTFYDDRAGWVKYARGNIAEAKRIAPGKPVYAFVWMQYHDSAGAIARTYIPYDFFLLQLQTIKDAGADGVVIWGGLQMTGATPDAWDETRGWWTATKEFIASLGGGGGEPPPSDTTAPVISNVQATDIDHNSATISWTTNEPSDTWVAYGLSPTNLSLVRLESASVNQHSMFLVGLSKNRTYYYQVASRDQAGNRTVSSVLSFQTLKPGKSG